jgi:hypothetical protein
MLISKTFFKVTHLSKYLWTRLCVESANSSGTLSSNNNSNENEFNLFISSNEKQPNSFQQLNSNYTLEQINERFWKQNRPIELFYQQVNSNRDEKSNRVDDSNENDLRIFNSFL